MIRRTTWIILAVFVVLLGAALYWQRNKGPSSTEATPTPQAVFMSGVESQSIASLKIESAEGQTVALERGANGAWALTEPTAGPADAGPVEANVSQLLTLRVVTALEAGLSMDDLGLAQPRYTITLGLSDGSQKVVRIGKATPTSSGYYAQLDGGPVEVVSKYGVDAVVEMAANPPVPPTPTGQAPAATEESPTQASPTVEGSPIPSAAP